MSGHYLGVERQRPAPRRSVARRLERPRGDEGDCFALWPEALRKQGYIQRRQLRRSMRADLRVLQNNKASPDQPYTDAISRKFF